MKIEVFHDTACPWCRIGKAHLRAALAEWEGEPVEVIYRTFFLNPAIPPEGHAFQEYMHAKGGGQVPMEQWFAAPRQAGEQAGLTFNFEQIKHAPNTTLSHQLIALAPPDKREAVMDAVYAAYFEHGRNIGDLGVLVDIATENDMDADNVRQQLAADAKRDEVLADVELAQRMGVTGVPFFVVNRRLAFSGAQPPAMILDVLRQANEEEGIR